MWILTSVAFLALGVRAYHKAAPLPHQIIVPNRPPSESTMFIREQTTARCTLDRDYWDAMCDIDNRLGPNRDQFRTLLIGA